MPGLKDVGMRLTPLTKRAIVKRAGGTFRKVPRTVHYTDAGTHSVFPTDTLIISLFRPVYYPFLRNN